MGGSQAGHRSLQPFFEVKAAHPARGDPQGRVSSKFLAKQEWVSVPRAGTMQAESNPGKARPSALGSREEGFGRWKWASLVSPTTSQASPPPPGDQDPHHPPVLFTVDARKDQAPTKLEVFSTPGTEAALTPARPAGSRCSGRPRRGQRWACYTWGKHSAPPATSPDTCGQKRPVTS